MNKLIDRFLCCLLSAAVTLPALSAPIEQASAIDGKADNVISKPSILILVLIFVVVSVISGIISFRIKSRSLKKDKDPADKKDSIQ